MGIQYHAIAADQEKRANEDKQQQKESSNLEKTLHKFDALKVKNGGPINLDRYLDSELSTLLLVCVLAKCSSEKSKPDKRKILCDNNITNERLTVFVDGATKRLNNMKEQLVYDVVLKNIEENQQESRV